MTAHIGGIGSLGGAGAAGTNAGATQGLGTLGSDAFLQLLVAQLKYQNPMEPTDGTAMLQHTAAFTTVETLKSIAALQQQLMTYGQVDAAVGMVGRSVTYLGEDGFERTGVVSAVRFSPEGPILTADGQEFEMGRVVQVAGD